MWGVIVLGLLLVPFYYIPYSVSSLQPPRFENAIDAVLQTVSSWKTGLVDVLLILILTVYNSCGMSITKEMSATTRAVLDSTRTVFIWAFSLIVKWDKFHYYQPVGYFLLLAGIAVFYNLLLFPRALKMWRQWKSEGKHDNANAPLLSGSESMAS
jgi:hypothetical protein